MQSGYFFIVSNKMKSVNEIIPLLGQSLSVITGLIDTALQNSYRPEKEINRTRLTTETILKKWLRVFPEAESPQLRLRVYKCFGYIRIILRIEGNPFNPVRHVEGSPLGFSGYEDALLTPMHRTISYYYADGVNEVEIKLPTFDAESMTFR